MSHTSVPNAQGAIAMEATRCIACGGPVDTERTLFDDRYGYPGRYRLLACRQCGHRMLDARMTPQQISDLYTNYYPRSSFDVEAWSPPNEVSGLRAWWQGLRASAFRWVPRGVRVLDIGCGFGESLGYHRNRGCDAHGVEADANILRLAARHNLNVRVGLFDPAAYEPESFDVVTLDQVIEHVSNPVTVLREVNAVLRPGGTLVLSTPNVQGWGARLFGRHWIHWHAPYHQHFFTRASFARAAELSGFRIESVRTVTSSAWLAFQWCHLIALSPEGARSTFWNAKLPRARRQRLLFKMAAGLDRLGVNAAITRLFDAAHLGDNRVYVLSKLTPR